ncbi:hypothetical protein EsDP_00006209 [Epichloe bromicola]|uniref:catechol O-methyltransferase n=1 Tax=Epichloe bromicola TaxID=79588 RepID=A0ABQ0CWY5_9HYPO
MGGGQKFDVTRAYAEQEEIYFDDGREAELLSHILARDDIDDIRGSPRKVLEAIDAFGTKRYLMNVGRDKGAIVTELIASAKPTVMVELGGYVGYSAILFADAVRAAGGKQYFCLEHNAEFASIIRTLSDLAGLGDLVTVMTGDSSDSLRQLKTRGLFPQIDLLFLDHYKPLYLRDLKLCEDLGFIRPGSILAADNVIKPGNPPYLEYVRCTAEQKRKNLAPDGQASPAGDEPRETGGNGGIRGNPSLIYESSLIESFEPTGVPNLCLFTLGVVFLPLGTISLVVAALLSTFGFGNDCRSNAGQSRCEKKRILVTGVSMSKGLAIARMLHRQGHTVIGADGHRLSSGRVSRAIRRFHLLPRYTHTQAYTARLLEIVRTERIHLWIPASDVGGALADGLAKEAIEARTSARVMQLGYDDVAAMDNKAAFMELVASLGLATPDTRRVGSASELRAFLKTRQQQQQGGTQYVVKPMGVDDVARYDMPLVPLGTEEETMARIDAIPFGRGTDFIAQEHIRGDEYCTHALVVRGKVRAFVACPSSELLMHYAALPAGSALSDAMLDFTKRVADAGGRCWTGHVSFDFLVRHGTTTETTTDKPVVYPIECNPRVHTAVLLFAQTPRLVDEYLSVLEPGAADGGEHEALYPLRPHRVYWMGQDLVESVVYPAYETFVLGTVGLGQLARSIASFMGRVRHWKDGIFEIWDPLPFWWTYHVQWPLLFLRYLFKGRWHKANVSTGKLFEAT